MQSKGASSKFISYESVWSLATMAFVSIGEAFIALVCCYRLIILSLELLPLLEALLANWSILTMLVCPCGKACYTLCSMRSSFGPKVRPTACSLLKTLRAKSELLEFG